MELTHKGLLEIGKLTDYEDIFVTQAKDVYPSFSKKHNKALNRYCHFGGPDRIDVAYDQINECIELIMNNESVEQSNKYEKSARAIISSFQYSVKIVLPVIYRGIRRKAQADHLATLQVGDIYQSKQAMSTSHSALVAFSNLDQNVALKIYDAYGIPLEHNFAEGEVLIDPKATFRIRDIYLEDWNDGRKTKDDVLVYELVMVPLKLKTRQRKLKREILDYVFYTISTLFIISMTRTSILLPQLFKQTNAYKFDYNGLISDSNQRQMSLVKSSVGLGQPFLLSSLFLFMCLCFYVFIAPNGKRFRTTYLKIAGATITASGILITIFSVWRAA